MKTPQALYNELSYYTLSLGDPEFIHQNIVDAFTAQQANERTKPIAITFALVGLYLHIEKNYSGREVQLAHMRMAKKRKDWPVFDLPQDRGAITVSDVLMEKPGKARDRMIRQWCQSVWKAYGQSHEKVISLAKILWQDL